MNELEKALEQEVPTTITKTEQLQQQFNELRKKQGVSEEDYLSALILLLQQKDYDEYVAGTPKSYYLSTFFKNELVIRSAKKGCTKTSFKISTQAAKAIIGLSFLTEDGSIQWSLKPLDKKTYLISFKLYSENMTNAQIHFFNSNFDLNIPPNEEIEVCPDEEQYENNFTQSNILQLIK